MPNYKITIYLRSGKKMTGIRYHSSQDIGMIKSFAIEKFKKAFPLERLDYVDVDPTALGKNIDVKNL